MPKCFDQAAMHYETQRYKNVFKNDSDIQGMCYDLERIN